jgi:predicted metal-binding membrane protein
MMLPTVLPLFDIFDRLTAGRRDHARLLGLLGMGYMAVWAAFGVLAHGLHTAMLSLFATVPTLAWNSWLIGVACVALAGAFQFSPLKYRCLDKCRAPLGFAMQHWRGGSPARQAFMLGAHHGLFCVGCCWALMLVMFAVGMGSLGWMLVLASAMAIEKNVAWGRHISAPLGVALMGWACVMAAIGLGDSAY